MITLEQAKKMFEDMIAKSQRSYQMYEAWEIDFDEPIYVMTVIDEDGVQHFPGDPFQSIRKSDGTLIDFEFPCPA